MLHTELITLIIITLLKAYSGVYSTVRFPQKKRPKKYIKVKKVIKVTFGAFFKRVWLESSRFGALPVQASLSACLCHEKHCLNVAHILLFDEHYIRRYFTFSVFCC